MLLLLSLLACREHPDGPPPPPDQPPSVDTAAPAAPAADAQEEITAGTLNVKTLHVRPEKPNATTDLVAKVVATGPKGRMVSVRYQWLRNEEPIDGATGSTLSHSALRRNDRVRLRVRVSDGENEVEVFSEPILIGNSPPVIEVPRGGLSGQVDGVKIKAHDPDNDTLTWRVKDGPPGLSIDSGGVLRFSGAKAAEGAGVYNAEIIVTDSGGDFAAWPITFDLRPGKADQKVLPGAAKP